jgi:hypothetical protein
MLLTREWPIYPIGDPNTQLPQNGFKKRYKTDPTLPAQRHINGATYNSHNTLRNFQPTKFTIS